MCAKFPPHTPIQAVNLYDDGLFLETVGYYAIGHWEKRSFAIACNKEFGFAGDRGVNTFDVRHLHLLNEDNDELVFGNYLNPNSQPVTHVEF